MDEELRKAQRLFQRAVGGNEIGLLELYYEQIKDYLRQQKLPLVFGGVHRTSSSAYHDAPLKTLHPEMAPCQNMSSRTVHFFYRADLDTKSSEEILKICCYYTNWSDWFTLAAYYQTFVTKEPGSYLWNEVLQDNINDPSMVAQDGTTYQQRLGAIFDKWNHFAIVCLLEPKYVREPVCSDKKPERWHNWTAQLQLVGYGKKE